MTAYIIKSAICMILLFGLYRIFLRREKLFVFNRYFLISSVLFSLVVPFLSIPISVPMVFPEKTGDIMPAIYFTPEADQSENVIRHNPAFQQEISGEQQIAAGLSNDRSLSTRSILLAVYLAGAGLMLFRFCRNIFKVNALFRMAEKIDNQWYRIALLKQSINPFSFLRTIFLNINDYREDRIAPNVLQHELEHVRQSHSRDIIFFEIVHILFWFNPVLILFKRAARINHEYLADDAVISKIPDMNSYAGDLINFISRRFTVPFTSAFNPSMIRLRLLMLNTTTSRKERKTKVLATLTASLLLFSVLSFRAEYSGSQKGQNQKNDNILIEEVFFRAPDFDMLKAQVVFNNTKLKATDTLSFDPEDIKYIDVLKDRKAIRKYGKAARDGVIEIGTYQENSRKLPDSLQFKPIYTVNESLPEGRVKIPVSNLYSFSVWTYPFFPNQDTVKQWRTISIMTRGFYRISGKIVQENGEPVPGVSIRATDNPAVIITDNEGRFLFKDVSPGARVEVTADRYEPVSFVATGAAYTKDLNITLDRKNENRESDRPANRLSNDFTGSWRRNNDLSRSSFPEGYKGSGNLTYNIRQYDSDSLFMNSVRMDDKDREFKFNQTIVFNIVKTDFSKNLDRKYKTTCTVSSDGQSFSISEEMKSIFDINRGYKVIRTYSIEEGRLIVRTNQFINNPSSESKQFDEMVFDRI